MAKIVYRKIKKAFKVEYGSSSNSINFQEGKYVLTIPKCDKNTNYMIFYKYRLCKMPNEYFSEKVYDSVKDIPNFKCSDLI